MPLVGRPRFSHPHFSTRDGESGATRLAAQSRLRYDGRMTGAAASPIRLTREQAAFLESGVSIIAAARDGQNRPLVGRCTGCRIAADGAVTLFLSRLRYPLLVDAIRRGSALAANFSEPSSNKSLQVKAATAAAVDLAPGDLDSIAAYLTLYAADLERIGDRAALARTVLTAAPGDLAAIRFQPDAIFTQTPGPAAGNRIGA